MKSQLLIALFPFSFLAGHLGNFFFGERSRIRLLLLRIFAKYVEVPLLRLSYLACVGRLKFLSKFPLTRWLLIYPIALPFGHFGDTGKPIPKEELVKIVKNLEGKIAVGPCRCRIGHKACKHPLETDIVIKTGAPIWLETHPHDYREIDREEAIRIIEDCANQGLFHMVFLHCPIGEAVNEYVICNCCTDGCVPYILNRTLSQKIYPLIKGDWIAVADESLCLVCGECISVCPFGSRKLIDGKTLITDCFGCGLCEHFCKGKATKMAKRDGTDP